MKLSASMLAVAAVVYSHCGNIPSTLLTSRFNPLPSELLAVVPLSH